MPALGAMWEAGASLADIEQAVADAVSDVTGRSIVVSIEELR